VVKQATGKPTDDHILALLRDEQTVDSGLRLLMDTYQEPLYLLLFRMVNLPDDARDLLQDTFIKAYRHIGSFRGQASLYTWLYRIATNEALSFLQKQKRQNVSLSIETCDQTQLRADTYTDGAAIEQSLLLALERLPPRQKIIFSLRYYEELPYETMSDLLQTSVGSLKASYHHAVKKIEHYLKESTTL
jgi:RNA polymerase sigma-70 factor, ECF subfamily